MKRKYQKELLKDVDESQHKAIVDGVDVKELQDNVSNREPKYNDDLPFSRPTIYNLF